MFSCKIHESKSGRLIAACDNNLLGQTFLENDTILTLKPEFYHEQIFDFEQILKELKNSKMANFVGPQLIEKLLAKKKIRKREIKTVSKVPHIQLFFLDTV